MTRVVRSVVREALTELANRKYQQRLWTASQGPEVGSLTEAIARLYDDSGLGDALDAGEEVFGRPVDGMLRNLAVLLVSIDDQRSPTVILNDPKIHEVRQQAAAVLREPAVGLDDTAG